MEPNQNPDRQRAANPAARPENPDHHHRAADHAAGRLLLRFDAGGQEHLAPMKLNLWGMAES